MHPLLLPTVFQLLHHQQQHLAGVSHLHFTHSAWPAAGSVGQHYVVYRCQRPLPVAAAVAVVWAVAVLTRGVQGEHGAACGKWRQCSFCMYVCKLARVRDRVNCDDQCCSLDPWGLPCHVAFGCDCNLLNLLSNYGKCQGDLPFAVRSIVALCGCCPSSCCDAGGRTHEITKVSQ
jgi:hypothetical protein